MLAGDRCPDSIYRSVYVNAVSGETIGKNKKEILPLENSQTACMMRVRQTSPRAVVEMPVPCGAPSTVRRGLGSPRADRVSTESEPLAQVRASLLAGAQWCTLAL